MLLVIDAGNTETVLGVFEGDELMDHWRIATVRGRTEDEYRLLLGGLLAGEGYERTKLTGVALASVVPPVAAALRAVASDLADGPLLEVGPGVKTGMPILIDNPREVGADRIVNAVARSRQGPRFRIWTRTTSPRPGRSIVSTTVTSGIRFTV